MRGTELMKHYRLRWESIAFPDMGMPEYVYAESPEEAEAKAEAEAPEEFKAVYYIDYVKEVQK